MTKYAKYQFPSGEVEEHDLSQHLSPRIDKPHYLRKARSQKDIGWGFIGIAILVLVALGILTWTYFKTPTVHADYEIQESQVSFCDHLKHEHAPLDYKTTLAVEKICNLK